MPGKIQGEASASPLPTAPSFPHCPSPDCYQIVGGHHKTGCYYIARDGIVVLKDNGRKPIRPNDRDTVSNNNLDAHYLKLKIQPLEIIDANNLDFNEANAIKYILRHKFKNGKDDLIKARFYLDRMIDSYGH